MQMSRINARLSGPLASFVELMVGKNGFYETPSEYIRDLIRRDMEARAGGMDRDAILTGYHDLAEGAALSSSGNFAKDMMALSQKEKSGWR